ncbi:MAG TPA: diacylglycerol kinase family lipid kinase [Bacteroidetes bacterium]|nr:diacylglycerol kinase family lipid kinase [Bacteroidota bacterium]
MKVFFVVNPAAGTSSKRNLPGLIKNYLDPGRFDPVVRFTEKPGHAREIAKEGVEQGVPLIYAVGGDGTVNEVAGALINTPAVLGILPMGSGNGLARHFRLPLMVRRSLKLLEKGKVVTMDYGMVNKIPFFCTAGVGFDAYVGKLFSEDPSRGGAVYVRKALEALFRYKPDDYTLIINGKQLGIHAFLVTFANASQYGNEAFIAPAADITDGLMDVVIFSSFPLIVAPALGIRLFTRMIDKSRFVQMIRCEKALLYGPSEKMVIHYDGETHQCGREMEVEIVKAGLRILVP